ncbi:MAG: hypothetical protein ACEPOV_06730 [Hyphomicrobiales bacterium]
MKRFYLPLLLGAVCAFTFSSCKKEVAKSNTNEPETEIDANDPMSWQNKLGMPDPEGEDEGLKIAEEDLLKVTHEVFQRNHNSQNLKWSEPQHNQYVYICAKKLGLSEKRAKLMGEASEMPDVTQVGLANGFNQQWSHAYMYSILGSWIWGDADEDFRDNIDGPPAGEKHEGYNDKSAKDYYTNGNQELGDWYLGYACHYIADASLVLHSTFIFPKVTMATYHFRYEKWVEDNWNKGHRFVDAVNSVDPSEFYTVTDPVAALVQTAENSNFYLSNFSDKAWDAYGESGYPKGVGTGNANTVLYTKKMISECTKWVGGSIKYGLDKYNQW